MTMMMMMMMMMSMMTTRWGWWWWWWLLLLLLFIIIIIVILILMMMMMMMMMMIARRYTTNLSMKAQVDLLMYWGYEKGCLTMWQSVVFICSLRDQAMQDTYWNSGICLLPGHKPYVTPILFVTVEMLRLSVGICFLHQFELLYLMFFEEV